MSLDRPWSLALLAIPVVLLWLRLRAQRPRDAEASSLLVWQKVSPSDTPPTRPRPPLSAWLEAAGAALLVIGIAQPWLAGFAPAAARVLVDASPSMKGRDLPPEAATGLGSLQVEEHLPSLLTAPGPMVVVTDHRFPAFPDMPGRLRVIGVGKRGFNAGISAVSGGIKPDGSWTDLVTVETFGALGPVEGRLLVPGRPDATLTVSPGRPTEVVLERAPAHGEIRIEFAGDCFPADDGVLIRPVGGLPVYVVGDRPAAGSAEERLVRALVAAGAISAGEFDRRGGPLALDVQDVWGPGPISSTGPVRTAVRIHVAATGGGGEVDGADVVAADHDLSRGVHIDPSVTLGPRATGGPLGGTAILADGKGALVTLSGDEGVAVVRFGFVPGSTWVERDPSFVVFAKNLVEYAAGGPARLEATGVLDPKETREAAEGETFGDLAAALAEARRPDPASRASFAAAALLAGAALLASAWFAGRHR